MSSRITCAKFLSVMITRRVKPMRRASDLHADKTKSKRKVFFYRGIGDFGLPLSVKIEGKSDFGRKWQRRNQKSHRFENRGGRIVQVCRIIYETNDCRTTRNK